MSQELLKPEEKSALKGLYTTPDVVNAVFPSVGQLDSEHQRAFLKNLAQWHSYLERELSVLLRVPSRFLPVQQAFLRKDQLWRGGEDVFQLLCEGPRPLVLLFGMPRTLAASFCERLFGAPMAPQKERALVPSEQSLLQELVLEWATQLSKIFGITEVRLVDEAPAESDPSALWLRVESPARFGIVEGPFFVALSIDGVRQLLGESFFVAESNTTLEEICERVGDVPVELHAVLGQAEFSLDALRSLRSGDVITLDRHSEDLVDVQLDNTTLFRARAGLAGQSVVLEIISGPKEKEIE